MTRAQMEVEGRVEGAADPNFALPPSLLRRYEVVVRPRSKAPLRKMREISADCIGSLATFKGICTQVGGVGQGVWQRLRQGVRQVLLQPSTAAAMASAHPCSLPAAPTHCPATCRRCLMCARC